MNDIVPPPHKISFTHRLRNYFLTGIVVCAPVVLTFYVAVVFLNFVDGRVASLLPSGIYPDGGIPGFGLVIGILFFVFVGWLATNFLGQFLIELSESIVERMPVIRTIYSGFKQVFEMVMGKQARAFREAVLVEFPMEKSWAIGFVTGTTQGEIQARTTDTVMNVFVPTTPNPTSGFLIFVPKERVVHGRMKPDQKDAVMQTFARGDIKILVATTVIEVGVNVPAATVMIIEHAERFGLAQLHQLRGRVGRGSAASYCFLLFNPDCGETARDRLKTMRDTEDGFIIAERDLTLRGPGDILGREQSGVPTMRLADLSAHADILEFARDDARLIISKDATLSTERGHALRHLLYLFERDQAIKLLQAG